MCDSVCECVSECVSDRRVLEISAMKAMRIGGKRFTKFWSCGLRKHKNSCSVGICYCYFHVFV